MVVLQPDDYRRIVDQLAADYHEHGIPLNDGVYKVATEMGLNPHHTRQISWQLNTKVHLDLFEKKAEDKNIEFPVCDPDYILRRMYTPEAEQPLPVAVAEKAAMDFYAGFESTEKTASDDDFTPFMLEAVEVSEKTAAARRGKLLRTLEKAASELDASIRIERELYVEGVYKLAFDLRKGLDREEFEKDAFAFYGDKIVPVLNDLRSVYKYPVVETEKLACEYDRLVDTRTAEMKALADVTKHFDVAVKLAHALKNLNSKLAGPK